MEEHGRVILGRLQTLLHNHPPCNDGARNMSYMTMICNDELTDALQIA